MAEEQAVHERRGFVLVEEERGRKQEEQWEWRNLSWREAAIAGIRGVRS